MATNYPTTLDDATSLPVEAASTALSVNHVTAHQNVQDAIEAIEAKVGVNSSAVTTSHDYKLSAVTGSDKALKSGTSTQSVTGLTLASPKITVGSDAVGDLHYVSNVDGTQSRLAKGNDNQILKMNGTALNWEDETTQDVTLYAQTGMVTPYVGSSAPTGWLLCDGSAVSRTTYAALFAIASTTYGVGDNSTTFNLPDLRSRLPLGAGTGTKVATFSSRSGNVITVTGLSNASNNEFQTGQAVLYDTTSGAISGLTDNTTYYVIRISNTTFSLATTLANAQNGTVITLSSDGSGTQTFTVTLTARTLGHTGGEENHAMDINELPPHTHTINHASGSGGGSAIVSNGNGTDNSANKTSLSTGSNAAMNNMQPFVVLNYIIKT